MNENLLSMSYIKATSESNKTKKGFDTCQEIENLNVFFDTINDYRTYSYVGLHYGIFMESGIKNFDIDAINQSFSTGIDSE